MPSSSVNNSEAIFFTSQFKNYIDRQPEPSDKERQPEPPVKIPEQP